MVALFCRKMKLHVFSVKRKNWKATLSCSSLEKHINTTALRHHINNPPPPLIFCRPLWSLLVSITASTLDLISPLYPESFLEISGTHLFKTFYKLESKPSEVTLCMKDGRQNSVVTDCTGNALAGLIGILKVVISLERDIRGIQKYFSSKIKDLVVCGMWLCFHEVSKEEKKKI